MNRSGGHIFLGITDFGKITGIDQEAIKTIKKEFTTTVNNDSKIQPPCYLTIEELVID